MLLDRPSDLRSLFNARETAVAARATGMGGALLQVRQLGAADLPAIEAHLLGLASPDRRARFLGNLTDAAIATYARGLDPSCTILIGAFHPRGRLVGLAEAHPAGATPTVEVAVSVDSAFRRRGLGRLLVAPALALAFARGAQSAEFNFAPGNCALVSLVLSLGGRVGPALGCAAIDRSADRAVRRAA